MSRQSFNNIRLKAYYWEKQLLAGRDDPKALDAFSKYSAQLEAIKAEREEQQAAKAQRRAELEATRWKKNIRRPQRILPPATTLKDVYTQHLMSWKPSGDVSFS